jgi:hypothetical protein
MIQGEWQDAVCHGSTPMRVGKEKLQSQRIAPKRVQWVDIPIMKSGESGYLRRNIPFKEENR